MVTPDAAALSTFSSSVQSENGYDIVLGQCDHTFRVKTIMQKKLVYHHGLSPVRKSVSFLVEQKTETHGTGRGLMDD